MMILYYFRETNSVSKLLYCVYILHSLKDKDFYIGSTRNLKERLTNHFHGQVLSTKGRRPLILVFCEYFRSKMDALRREKYFKTSAGKRTLRLMLQDSLSDLI